MPILQKTALLLLSALLISACSNPPRVTSTHSLKQQEHVAAKGFTGEKQRLIGRFDTSQVGQVQFSWPGSALEFRFLGTQASIAMASNGRARFEVAIDGTKSDLWVEAGNKNYLLATNLISGEHQVRITRITESFNIVTAFTSDPLINGPLLTPPAPPQKRLLVIGDSITAGYGDEGTLASCSYAMETSNQQLTYAARAAKFLRADLHTIAWSGIGAWRSYGEKTPVNPTILTRYKRTLANDNTSAWDTSRYQPNAILINIGTNDFWDGAAGDEYRRGMNQLIDQIETDYPNKPIYLILSPMLHDALRASQKKLLSSLASANIKLLDLGKIEASDGWGCDYHPNKITHKRLGMALAARLKEDLQW